MPFAAATLLKLSNYNFMPNAALCLWLTAQNHNLTLHVGCYNLKYANRADEPF